jgi:hypothetical protein
VNRRDRGVMKTFSPQSHCMEQAQRSRRTTKANHRENKTLPLMNADDADQKGVARGEKRLGPALMTRSKLQQTRWLRRSAFIHFIHIHKQGPALSARNHGFRRS